MTVAQPSQGSPSPSTSVFGRSESVLAHSVYGLILTMATLGELLHHEVAAGTSVAWLLGAGAVLFAAHMFSDVLAHVAVRRDTPHWNEILRVGHEDVSVTYSAVAAALVMAIAALADLDSERALMACVVVGLVGLGVLTAYATAHHRRSTQLLMSVTAVVLGAVIVTLENAV
jgi:hypothetical protein